MGIGSLGFGEMLVILIIILVLFGAKRVPEIGASFGKGIREFKKNINEADRQIREPMRDALRSNERVAGSEAATPRREETERPEPKRLM